MTDSAQPKKRRGWLLPLLLVSLAFNFLILGAVGSMIVRHYLDRKAWGIHDARRMDASWKRHATLGRPGRMLRASRRLLRELPEERRKALSALVRKHGRTIREAYVKVGEARARLAALIAAEPFDEGAYAAAMKELRKADAAARMKVLDLADAFLRALTPQERRRYAELLRDASRYRYWRSRH